MKRARQIKALETGLKTVYNLCQKVHVDEVYEAYQHDEARTLEHILFEIKLAVEFSLMQYDQEKEKGL